MMYQQYQKGWIEVISGCMFAGKTEELIKESGLELLHVYDAFTRELPAEDSERIYFVCRRPARS